MIYFLLTLWVNLFFGGDFSVTNKPDGYIVQMSPPTFNHTLYGGILSPGDYNMEYDVYVVHIFNGVSSLQHRRCQNIATFKAMKADMITVTVICHPIGNKPGAGNGQSFVVGQRKIVPIVGIGHEVNPFKP